MEAIPLLTAVVNAVRTLVDTVSLPSLFSLSRSLSRSLLSLLSFPSRPEAPDGETWGGCALLLLVVKDGRVWGRASLRTFVEPTLLLILLVCLREPLVVNAVAGLAVGAGGLTTLGDGSSVMLRQLDVPRESSSSS